jgi:hypothetical protein
VKAALVVAAVVAHSTRVALRSWRELARHWIAALIGHPARIALLAVLDNAVSAFGISGLDVVVEAHECMPIPIEEILYIPLTALAPLIHKHPTAQHLVRRHHVAGGGADISVEARAIVHRHGYASVVLHEKIVAQLVRHGCDGREIITVLIDAHSILRADTTDVSEAEHTACEVDTR